MRLSIVSRRYEWDLNRFIYGMRMIRTPCEYGERVPARGGDGRLTLANWATLDRIRCFFNCVFFRSRKVFAFARTVSVHGMLKFKCVINLVGHLLSFSSSNLVRSHSISVHHSFAYYFINLELTSSYSLRLQLRFTLWCSAARCTENRCSSLATHFILVFILLFGLMWWTAESWTRYNLI